MSKKTNNKAPQVGFNTLRKKLPHRYTVQIAEKLVNISPSQVKCVFKGELKNPDIVKKVHSAAIKIAAEYQAVLKLSRRKPAKSKA